MTPFKKAYRAFGDDKHVQIKIMDNYAIPSKYTKHSRMGQFKESRLPFSWQVCAGGQWWWIRGAEEALSPPIAFRHLHPPFLLSWQPHRSLPFPSPCHGGVSYLS